MEFVKRHNTTDTSDFFPRQLVTDLSFMLRTCLLRGNWCNGLWFLSGAALLRCTFGSSHSKLTSRLDKDFGPLPPIVCLFMQSDFLLDFLVAASVAVSGVRLINEVNRHWARLVLGWVTVWGRVNHFGM